MTLFEAIVESTSLGTVERGTGVGGAIPLVKMGCLKWGSIELDDVEYVSDKIVKSEPNLILKDGDFLFNTRNTADLVGKSAVWHQQAAVAVCDNNIMFARMKEIANPDFVCLQMCNGKIKKRLRALACGSTSVAAIYWKDLSRLPIFLPARSVQDKIVSVIGAWQKHIDILASKLAAHFTIRQGLMQQLLTGKRRFPGFTKPWRKRTIGDVAEASSVRNNGRLGSESVRAVNKAEGMIPMKEHVMADDLSRYQVVKNHWFAYNPMRINIGSICQWLGQEDALVSPDYVVFRCRDEVIDHRYFNAFRRSDAWSSFMDTAGAGGVRIRIYFDDLAQLPIPLPELDEQRRIADLFDIVDREIELLERLLSAYRTQKKGLMQQLLTGKRRVKVQAA